ncbi:transcriptional regulator, TetR family [Saccharopolyspora shandongensis]|uniref:Transcriptional regulator, TetR family n=1 Tax=Saccharopolyspora shandongensis TaxID=418495 RepID=A0A1H3NTW1_9PSEU|nr:transcriptional regulator, TetR family [Saccharopolyspora shandongensis]
MPGRSPYSDGVTAASESSAHNGSAIPRGQGGDALSVAAREIFAERGYHGASIRDIAKRAGLSLSALYYWHSSKQELFAGLLEDSVNDYVQACDAALRDCGDDPAERLSAIVRATVDYRVRRRVESTIAVRDIRNLEDEHARRLGALRESATRLFQDIIDDGVRRGEFRCEHPAEARRAIQAACNAIPQWYDPESDVGPAELADRYVAIALRIVGA